MNENVVLPLQGDDSYVELSDSKQGKIFRKQILRMGESFVHPADKSKRITIDENFAKTLVRNFKNGVCDIVQFPLVNDKNQHVENPDANLGRVIDLSYDDKGVWTDIDVRKHADAVGSTILGASAMMSLDYVDTITGERKGPTLLHVAATNRPYLTNLAPYEAVALSNYDEEYVMLSPEDNNDSDSSETESENPMSLEELLAKLKEDFDIDVAALQSAAEEQTQASENENKEESEEAAPAEETENESAEETSEPAEEAENEPAEETSEDEASLSAVSDSDAKNLFAALSAVLVSADPDLVSLSKSQDDMTIVDLADGIVELSNNYKALNEDVKRMKTEKATSEVDAAVANGLITPAQRDGMLELRLSNEALYAQIIPSEPIVELSARSGVTGHEPVNTGAGIESDRQNLVSAMSKYANKTKS